MLWGFRFILHSLKMKVHVKAEKVETNDTPIGALQNLKRPRMIQTKGETRRPQVRCYWPNSSFSAILGKIWKKRSCKGIEKIYLEISTMIVNIALGLVVALT